MQTAAYSIARETKAERERTSATMPRILVVDDEASVRGVIKEHLSSSYEVIETGLPETVLSLSVTNQPDAILLDLSMPGLSGYELCRTLASLSFTQRIPIFILSGQDERNSAFCLSLGAVRYFKKPVDFVKLKAALAQVLQQKKEEQRAHKRFALRAILKLRVQGKDGSNVEVRAITENVSSGGFLCVCSVPLEDASLVEVFSWDEREYYLGKARLVRTEHGGASTSRYAFQFITSVEPQAKLP